MGRFTLFIVLTLLSCKRYPAGVEETLSLAGSNRGELKKVLRHYREHPDDTLKYKAACFLIDNMKWHLSLEQVNPIDSTIYKFHAKFDHLYESAIVAHVDSSLNDQWLQNRFWEYSFVTRKLMEVSPPDTPTVRLGEFPDPRYISSDFLISHVENAFQAWEHSPYASRLTFEEFKEYILPYRAIVGYPFYENGKKLNAMFGKWLNKSTQKDLSGYITRYRHYTDKIRNMFGIVQPRTHVGLYDLFIGYKGDCISIANNACNIFRAFGLPIAVDYNISYREKTGRHFHGVFIDSSKKHHYFNALPYLDRLSPRTEWSNSYFRNTFGAQPDSPFLLRNEGESLPEFFETPCIKEVTGEVFPVAQIQLPFKANAPNHLAYLYTYHNNPRGIIPSTWGTIDKHSQKVTFKNVVFNLLYFPVYLQKDSIIAFGDPFYLTPDNLSRGYKINYPATTTREEKGTLLLLRKYPPKTYMLERAQRMVGGRLEGANRKDFSDAELLYTIRETPPLNLQEHVPYTCKPFQYYRYVAPAQYPQSNLSILELLTDSYTTLDSLEIASPRPIYSPDEIKQTAPKKTYAKPKRVTSNNTFVYLHPAFNNNMQEASHLPVDEISLNRPIVVKKIRIAPMNAENHILIGEIYELMYWDGEWKSAGRQRARYNFLPFDNVPLNKIYWLRNLTKGKEELPFFYQNGKQKFIYHDTITPAPEATPH